MKPVNEHNIRSMVMAIDFIETHLKDPITVGDMADAVAYSIFHFCRIFNATVHHTPYDYLMRRRLTEAAKELTTTSRKVIEVALDYQFNSPEVFSRAFKRFLGQSPLQWKKAEAADQYMPKLTERHLIHRSQLKGIPELVSRQPFVLQGLMAPILNTSDMDEAWATLHHLFPSLIEHLPSWGVYWKSRMPSVSDYYFAGVETNEPLASDLPVSTKSFPYTRYLKWQHYGDRSTLPLSLDYVYHTWQPKTDIQLTPNLRMEEISTDGNSDTLMLWIPVQSPSKR